MLISPWSLKFKLAQTPPMEFGLCAIFFSTWGPGVFVNLGNCSDLSRPHFKIWFSKVTFQKMGWIWVCELSYIWIWLPKKNMCIYIYTAIPAAPYIRMHTTSLQRFNIGHILEIPIGKHSFQPHET